MAAPEGLAGTYRGSRDGLSSPEASLSCLSPSSLNSCQEV
jgi:hypothetical protein